MAEVKVTHKDLGSEESKVPPKREVLPEGEYMSVIMGANVGTTNFQPPLYKVAVEFQILHSTKEPENEAYKGRRVFQDYIVEHDPANEEMSAQRRYELRMLLDATNTPFTDDGFNTDHLVQKACRITIKHRRGKAPADPKEPTPIFMNVRKVDSPEDASEEDLI